MRTVFIRINFKLPLQFGFTKFCNNTHAQSFTGKMMKMDTKRWREKQSWREIDSENEWKKREIKQEMVWTKTENKNEITYDLMNACVNVFNYLNLSWFIVLYQLKYTTHSYIYLKRKMNGYSPFCGCNVLKYYKCS